MSSSPLSTLAFSFPHFPSSMFPSHLSFSPISLILSTSLYSDKDQQASPNRHLLLFPQVLDKYPLDSIRYYLCASVTYGADLSFSEASLITMHNSELADILGNLVHR